MGGCAINGAGAAVECRGLQSPRPGATWKAVQLSCASFMEDEDQTCDICLQTHFKETVKRRRIGGESGWGGEGEEYEEKG